MSSMQTPSSSSGRLPYPGGAINPNDLPAEQRISLMRLQGPVSVLLAYHQDPQAKTLEATRKRMEAKGVLAGVEECRAREELILDLERQVKSCCLPSLFGIFGNDVGLHLRLNQTERGLSANYGSQLKNTEDRDEIEMVTAENQDTLFPRISVEKAANLVLSSSQVMFSLANECNPSTERFLRETLPGSAVVLPATFGTFGNILDAFLTDLLTEILRTRIQMGKITEQPVDTEDVFETFRSMERQAQVSR